MKQSSFREITDSSSNYLGGLIESLTKRGRFLLKWDDSRKSAKEPGDLLEMSERLLSRRGEASGVALAGDLAKEYECAGPEEKLAYLLTLAEHFGPERRQLESALEALRSDPSPENLTALHSASEPRRQQLFRRLNLAPGGTKALIRMREDLLSHLSGNRALAAVDADFAHLFASWFNRGFLVLRPIDWSSPANILEKIIQYEAVHEIRDWDDLRSRLQPGDRRCYAFFHPQLVDEPLIFVEVALTAQIPARIGLLLDTERAAIPDAAATTAVFYSISNTQKGLRGVTFGNFLIKQVVENLKAELPGLTTFVTLSPVPGFAAWLDKERNSGASVFGDTELAEKLRILDEPGWADMPSKAQELQTTLQQAAAYYLLRAKNANGKPLDPVAQFHLGNGARLERINYLGDGSPKGLRQAHGLMVNYLYQLDEIEANHEAFAEGGEVAAAHGVRKQVPVGLQSRDLVSKQK